MNIYLLGQIVNYCEPEAWDILKQIPQFKSIINKLIKQYLDLKLMWKWIPERKFETAIGMVYHFIFKKYCFGIEFEYWADKCLDDDSNYYFNNDNYDLNGKNVGIIY
jgi:hypothetical protein